MSSGKMSEIKYSWEEIALFVSMIAGCLIISVYFCLKRSTANNYASGGRPLGVWPLSMSTIATSLSSITFGLANDIYQFGPHAIFESLGVCLSGIVSLVLIPVLLPLKLQSLNEYGALRFDKNVKVFMSLIMLMFWNLHTSVIGYSTGLFASQVSGLSTMTCFLIIMISSYALTSIGGFKGVVWTDTLQAIAMLVSVFVLAVLGFMEVGSVTEIFNDALKGDRLTFDWGLDPTKRLTVWSAIAYASVARVCGNSITSPTIFQRYTALPTQREARKMAVITALGVFFILAFTFLLGFIMYSLFNNCDPVLSGKASTYDQVLPYFIEYIGERAKLARGVYIVGFISASISTITSEINTYSVTIYEDFIRNRIKANNYRLTQFTIHFAGLLMVGISILLVYFFQNFGSIFELSNLLFPPAVAYTCIILIGIFVPWIGSKGVLWASFSSFLIITWIVIGTRMVHSRGLIKHPVKPMGVKDCVIFNSTRLKYDSTPVSDSSVFFIYKMTTFLHSFLCAILMFAIAILVTCITGSKEVKKLDRRLLSPWVRRCLSEEVEDKGGEDVLLKSNVRNMF